MKKHTNTYLGKAGSCFTLSILFLKLSFLFCFCLSVDFASAQQTMKQHKSANGGCAIVDFDNDANVISPAGNFIPGCSPIKFTIRICYWGDCDANDKELTFRVPTKFTNVLQKIY